MALLKRVQHAIRHKAVREWSTAAVFPSTPDSSGLLVQTRGRRVPGRVEQGVEQVFFLASGSNNDGVEQKTGARSRPLPRDGSCSLVDF